MFDVLLSAQSYTQAVFLLHSLITWERKYVASRLHLRIDNMPGYLESEAPEAFRSALQALEARADEWFIGLSLWERPWNCAAWGTLSTVVDIIEHVIQPQMYRGPEHNATLLNLGRAAPLVLQHIQNVKVGPEKPGFRLDDVLRKESALALDAANRFITFTYTFPLWYRGRYRAELLSPSRIKFTAVGGAQQRRVLAFQKGFRPQGVQGLNQPERQPEMSDFERREFLDLLSASWPNGPRGFFYPRPFALLVSLHKKYFDRITTAFRRGLSLSLGSYNLGEFASFYAALLAVCALHDHLCYLWGNHTSVYPADSALIVKQRSSWIDICSRLSSLSASTIDGMITDLSYGTTRPTDLHVHPFVPLSTDSTLLSVAPQFPLHSSPDENILRVCSHIRKDAFDMASLGKEDETRQQLGSIIKMPVQWKGPITLPSPNPDVDLMLTDECSSTLLICELKWLRKPFFALDYIRADEEFRKGLRQLQTIKQFLDQQPRYFQQRGLIDRSIADFRHIHYLLVSRDHFLWTEPAGGIAVVDFEPFWNMLAHTTDLSKGVARLLEYSWLPEEGRDFEVRTEYAISNGVVVDSELFYPIGAANIAIAAV